MEPRGDKTPGLTLWAVGFPGTGWAWMLGLLTFLAVWMAPPARAQAPAGATPVPDVGAIDIKFVGPATVSEDLIRANIRIKVGDPFNQLAADRDVESLYATGFFYNIRVNQQRLADDLGDESHSAESHAMADLRFHLAIAEASRNPFMRSVGNLIEAALVGVFKLSSPTADPDTVRTTRVTHRRIADAVAARDVETARQAMEHVILSGLNRVRLALRQSDLPAGAPRGAASGGDPVLPARASLDREVTGRSSASRSAAGHRD